jgi:hypothetical protein
MLNPEWATALITLFGFSLAIQQLRQSGRAQQAQSLSQRAQFLLDTTERYFGDVEVRKLYYDIDYRKFEIVYEGGNPREFRRGEEKYKPFLGSDEERLLDSLLYMLDTIGRVLELGVLDRQEAAIFAFQANRVLSHESVTSYIAWITRERGVHGGETPAFKGARSLAALAQELRLGQGRPT